MQASFILFEDEDWLVVNKPTGLAVTAPQQGKLGVLEWLKLHLNKTTHLCHHLANETSGVLVLAKNKGAQTRFKQHGQNVLGCEYVFWSHKSTPTLRWTHNQPIRGEAATTHFEWQKEATGYHQYRANVYGATPDQVSLHATACEVPILGDNPSHSNRVFRPMLHLAKVTSPLWPMPLNAPVPPSFAALATNDVVDIALATCEDRRLGWIASLTNAYRVVHRGEIHAVPFAAEIYGNRLSVWSYTDSPDAAQTLEILQPWIEKLMASYACDSALVRTSNRDPHHNQLTRAAHWIGPPRSEPFWIHEHGLHYRVQLIEGKHSGLFLDQRDSRRRVALQAARQRVANLFSFTCSFSQVAIAQHAEVVFSVDLAKGCLRTGIQNLETNQLDGFGIGKFIREDARKWLERQVRRKRNRAEMYSDWDFIICDPPVFAASQQKGTFNVSQAWSKLVAHSSYILAPNGTALFANNHRGGDDHAYENVLKKHFKQVIPLDPPLDFPLTNGTHVRTYWCH